MAGSPEEEFLKKARNPGKVPRPCTALPKIAANGGAEAGEPAILRLPIAFPEPESPAAVMPYEEECCLQEGDGSQLRVPKPTPSAD